MNTGAFGEGFPYTNFHDLNTDWIIKIVKDFLDQYTHIEELISDGEDSLTELTNTGLASLQSKKEELEALLQAWYDTHSQDIANQLATALSTMTSTLNTYLGNMDSKYSELIANLVLQANTELARVLASIPSDYTALEDRVDDLEEDMIKIGQDRLIDNRTVSAFPYAGATFTYDSTNHTIYANSTIKPYCYGDTHRYACSFILTLPEGHTDFWIGVGTTHNTFIGVNLLSPSVVRAIPNNAQSAPEYTPAGIEATALTANQQYGIIAVFDYDNLRIWANNVLVVDLSLRLATLLDTGITGISFLNFGLSSGIVSWLETYDNNYSRDYWKKLNGLGNYETLYQSSLAYIDNTGLVEIAYPNNWNDAPSTVSGVLGTERMNNNYNIQTYREYGDGNNGYFTRVVNVNTHAVYRDWQAVGLAPNNFTVDETYMTTHSYSSFANLPENQTYKVHFSSSSSYATYGFPIAELGTFMKFRPAKESTYGYAVYIYFTHNNYYATPKMYIAFGEGSAITPWKLVNNAPSSNYLADALISGEDIVFAGDSVIAGLGSSDYSLTGDYIMDYNGIARYENVGVKCWVNQFIAHLKGLYGSSLSIKNRGIGGMSITALATNWDTIVGTTPKTVIIGIGVNEYNSPTDLTGYVWRTIASKLSGYGQKLMIVNAIPNNTENKALYDRTRAYISKASREFGVDMIDMFGNFLNQLEIKNLTLNDVIGNDGIHPNDTGYAIMFEIAKQVFGV